MWKWIKEFFFGIETKVEQEVKVIENKVDAEIKKKVDDIVDLGKKIEAKIDEEVKTVKSKAKAKLDVNKDGKVNVDDAKEVVKRVTRKKK